MRATVLVNSSRKIVEGGIYEVQAKRGLGMRYARSLLEYPHFEKMLYDNALLIDLLWALSRHKRVLPRA